LSTIAMVIAGEDQAADPLAMDAATLAMMFLWLGLMILPLWAVRWIHPDGLVRRVVAAFVCLLVLGELTAAGYSLALEAETPMGTLSVMAGVVTALLLAAGLGLAILLRRRPQGLQGLHGELSWALIAYVVLSAASVFLPEVLLPLAGVPLTVVYVGLGIILRRAGRDAA